MGCLKLDILDEQYKRTELKITRSRKELTFDFCGENVGNSRLNAFDQMKAYSDNKDIYGYYGYDDKGERTYKLKLTQVEVRANALGGSVIQAEGLSLYPNGYLNLDQHGNYTKHYYADAMRVASKIGSGFKDSICSNGDSLQSTALYNVMLKELTELTGDTIDYIDYPFEQITHLQGDSGNYEDGLFFWHGNHLSSTELITDMTGNISQAVLYTPHGQIISEYRADWKLDTIPRFLFNAKELDEESGLYYFNARYYEPTGRFISRDPHFERYFYWSPYCAFFNNPLKYIDPTGMDGEVTDLVIKDNTNKTNHTEQLTTSLSGITGLTVETETRGGRTFLNYAKNDDGTPRINTDANGNATGSEDARNMLMGLIDNPTNVNIDRVKDGRGSFAPLGGDQIGLDFSQIGGFMNGVQGGLNKETMGYGMVFLHEFLHTGVGGSLQDKDVVPAMNTVRSQLGANFGQRTSYSPFKVGVDNYIPFDSGSKSYLQKGITPAGFNMYIRY